MSRPTPRAESQGGPKRGGGPGSSVASTDMPPAETRPEAACSSLDCGCDGSIPRRDFLRLTSLAAAGAAGSLPAARPVMAGPFEDVNEYLRLIPQDKRLDPAWIRSLYERGQKATHSEPQALARIGMPVGGLFAGTVYLSGDGRLWLWDIFNRDQEGIQPRTVEHQGQRVPTRNGANYIHPAASTTPFAIGFALIAGGHRRTLDADGFRQVTFDGRYPQARVAYRDPDSPLRVELAAGSPFVPLDVDRSSLPAVILRYTIQNDSDVEQTCEIRGVLENPIALNHRGSYRGQRVNRILREPAAAILECTAREQPAAPGPQRPEIVFADFETDRYEGWTAAGEAFGEGPVATAEIPGYQGDVAGRGRHVVNSHASAPGSDVREKDAHVGTLTSDPFTIPRKYINFLIGGGAHRGQTCLNLLIDGQVVASATGRNNNRMQPAGFAVAGWEGKTARLQIVDQARGGWGNVGVDQIVFSDRPAADQARPFEQLPDFGTMALAVLGDGASATASAACDPSGQADAGSDEIRVDLVETACGTVGRSLRLPPGGAETVTFVVAWHFPNFYARGLSGRRVGHRYAARFASATDVARRLAADFDGYWRPTEQWVETWYDSTLPFWLLDRTMANTSTLATTTCYRFEDGRFWAWEGIGCCQGTCTHVWHYAQAPGRLFPEIERITRDRVDFRLALHDDGGIGMRAGWDTANHPAHDGQCGRILGVYREHRMSADDRFLRRLWPRVKSAVEYLLRLDGNFDGMIEGPQPNTLDAAWFGKISFLASLYLAALRAGEAMAEEMDDRAFAARCRETAERGAESILETFNGEYFAQIEDPRHPADIGVGSGCYVDQVFGQTWAHWVGLGRLFDRDRQLSALRSLWRYNFVPDVGPFREHFTRGRWYALAGDAGLLMCTWPKGGKNPEFQRHWQSQYFNECMSGFEWQAAAHMIWEGADQPDVLEHGLAIARAIHDRYDAAVRNPYNEIECSDHYARAMASYGVFQAVCGFQNHGPRGHLGFDPRLFPDDFQAAFTTAGGWGRFAQRRNADVHTAAISVRWGTVRLRTIGLRLRDGFAPTRVAAAVAGEDLPARLDCEGVLATVTLAEPREISAGTALTLELT